MLSVSILTFDLSDNATGRADLLARLLAPRYRVHVVGPRFGRSLWGPARETGVEHREVEGSRYPRFAGRASALARLADGDILYASKLRPTSFGIGLLARVRRRRRVERAPRDRGPPRERPPRPLRRGARRPAPRTAGATRCIDGGSRRSRPPRGRWRDGRASGWRRADGRPGRCDACAPAVAVSARCGSPPPRASAPCHGARARRRRRGARARSAGCRRRRASGAVLR